jgi:acyl-CoA thioester hydrolase
MIKHCHQIRVRYSESDRMGTYYNSRLLEWMEVGRSELMRAAGVPYVEWEAQGVMAPLLESHLRFRGRAGYDDLLDMETVCTKEGRARIRFSAVVTQAETGAPVAEGYTVHVLTDPGGKPLRIPDWVEDFLAEEKETI